MSTYRNFVGLIDRHLLLILALSMAATALCDDQGWVAEMPTSLIGTAVVFPIVFSIHAAYRRREEVLKALAAIQGDASTLLLAVRHWPVKPLPDVQRATEEAIGKVLQTIRDYLHEDRRDVATRRAVHVRLDELHGVIERIRDAGVAPPDMSRANQSLRFLHVHFEELANVARYRTPLSLRAYSKVFLNAFPLLFAPQFALVVQTYGAGLGYGLAAVYTVVLVALDNVQDRLEDPFDRDGLDDVDLDLHERQRLRLEELNPLR